MGKRCPQCGWLDEETATHCFRCGYRYNVDPDMAQTDRQLGVTLPPARHRNAPESGQLLPHPRPHPPAGAAGTLPVAHPRQALRLSRGFDQLICLDELDLEHYEHQIETALQRPARDARPRPAGR